MKTLTIIILLLIGVTLQAQDDGSFDTYEPVGGWNIKTINRKAADSTNCETFTDTIRKINLSTTWHPSYRLIPNPSWDDSSISGELLSDYIRKIIREEDAYPNDLIHVVGAKEGALLIVAVLDAVGHFSTKF